MALTISTVTLCSGCMEDVVIEDGIVSILVASNGLRGSKHVPAHVVTAEITFYGDDLLVWDCPACGYADSFDPNN
jgi:hypothetical protein